MAVSLIVALGIVRVRAQYYLTVGGFEASA